ncbi:MAG TPA: ROK family protein [Acidothermaceae bacterium]
MATVGVDIGGSKIAAVLLNESGEIGGSVWRRHDGPVDVVDLIAGTVAELSASSSASIDCVGVSIAAWLSADRLRVLVAANLGVTDAPLGQLLTERLGVPVFLQNDGDATAYAEYARGAGQGARTLVAIALGTGVGGGVVINGQVLVGAGGLGGELGHLQVEADGPRCTCGGVGCLELYASGRAVAEAAQDSLGSGNTAAEVVAAARSNDGDAIDILAAAGRAVGRAIGRIAAVVDPDLVVLSGSLAESAGDLIIEPAATELRQCWPLAAVSDPVPIRLGSCGRTAAALGAAAMARVALESQAAHG